MRATIRKLGNDAVVRLPPEIMAAAGIGVGSEVEVNAGHSWIAIGPARANCDLEGLIAGITPGNRHEALGDDEPVGREWD
jgi:antitoxin component of MazEF toxin-antitoxin module